MEQLLALYRKYREVVLYLVFGGLTTLLNYVVYIACFYLLPFDTTTVPNLIAWVAGVLFAYGTNRTWVFRSKASGFAGVGREMASFAGARVFTLLLETLILYVSVDAMGLYRYNLAIKLGANVVVIVLNYLFSKFWIFKQKPAK